MTTLSKNQNKLIRSLARKKTRNELGLFLVEGDKMVREVLNPPPGGIPCRVEFLVATSDWLAESGGSIHRGIEHFEVKAAELRQVSTLQQPNGALAIVKQMDYKPDIAVIRGSLTLALENIQDPGNLGTIIRIADWFGIRDIICSTDCVELYNPKVIQSTMGSFLRVRVHQLDLGGFFASVRDYKTGETSRKAETTLEAKTSQEEETTMEGRLNESGYFAVFAAAADGVNLFESSLPAEGLILLGNESKGLSAGILKDADRVLSIPNHDACLNPESLNVATAAAIFCAEFRRQNYSK